MQTPTADLVDTGYLRESRFIDRRDRDQQGALVLETAVGLTPHGLVHHPVLFSGQVLRPDVAAGGLRSLVEIASTRYFNPIPGGFASLDPIVTAQGDRLRCEAFSACNGVYARLDLLGQSLDERALGFGTTNIDINPLLALALAGIAQHEPLHLQVGPEQITFAMPGGQHTERKVALPERWVRAIAETQCLASGMVLRAELDGMAWRRFAQGLSTAGGNGAGTSLWVVPSPGGLRQTRRPQRGAVALNGTARLSAIRRLQHLVQRVRVYGPEVSESTPSAIGVWEFQLPGARLSLMLSPEPYRGFSGEGAVLASLGRADNADAQTLSALLAWEPCIDPAALAQEAQLPVDRVGHALTVLATSGQVGFDLHEQRYFHRQLPFGEDRVRHNYPRLEAAKKLVADGAVSTQADRHRVEGEHGTYWVVPHQGRLQCTCLFEAKYSGTRGPCKHALAVHLFTGLPAVGGADAR
jgi:hypothetical protein